MLSIVAALQLSAASAAGSYDSVTHVGFGPNEVYHLACTLGVKNSGITANSGCIIVMQPVPISPLPPPAAPPMPAVKYTTTSGGIAFTIYLAGPGTLVATS